jgi:CHAT domain-containing protein
MMAYILKLALLRFDLGMILMEKLLPLAMLAFITLSPAQLLASSSEKLKASDTESSVGFSSKLALGENYRNQGNYALAATEFESVMAQAEKNGDRQTLAMAVAALGYNQYLVRDTVKAQALLDRAGLLAKLLNSPALSALIDDYLGMLYRSLQRPEKAAVSFSAALKNAQLTTNKALIIGIRLNQAGLDVNDESRLSLLENLSTEVLALKDNAIKIKLLLTIGEQLLAMPPADSKDGQQRQVKDTYQVLNSAYQLADTQQKVRLRSQATGYLGRLYSEQNRNEDALLWLDKAIFDAQQVTATDLLMKWELLSGQIFHANGDNNAALLAYKHAVKHLMDIRYGVPGTLHNGRSSIKEFIDPIFRGLADILLLQASQTSSNEVKQGLLKQAIEAMETIKKTELEDYFNDRCLVDDKTSINLKDALLPGIGIIYPVILPDRVELLFRAGDTAQFEQQSVPVPATEVVDTAMQMTQFLRDGEGNYRPASRKLYGWLFKAYDDRLKAKGLTTVVYVPDGPLRQVPFSALLKDKKFVIEDYTVVTLPGLTLKNKGIEKTQQARVLIAALSKPDGASIDELMQSSIEGVLGERGIVDTSEVAGATTENPPQKVTREQLVEKLSLPSINDEVSELQKNRVNTTLLNQAFTYGGIKQSVSSDDYSIIHIASHGYFGKNADESFVMTYDRNLKLGDFQSLLSTDKVKKAPIDLITLSACQTAAGDDRALLGFSGMAIKTNALSAIGTLWSVNDEATATLMKAFYADLNRFPKAQALRQAQLTLLGDKELKHPHYWSPFIMVGHW